MKDKDEKGSISMPKLRRLLIRAVHVANQADVDEPPLVIPPIKPRKKPPQN